MSPFWLMVGVLAGLSLFALMGWGLFQFYSRVSVEPEEAASSNPPDSLDGWEWFGEEELAERTGLLSGKRLPLSIEKESFHARPGWVRLHISVAHSQSEIIRQAVGEGLRRIKIEAQGGEVRVYTDGKWVGTGGLIQHETKVSWLEGLTDREREALIRQLRNKTTPVYWMRKRSL